MKIPNSNNAIIPKEKVCDYLLNAAHRRGGAKARVLIAMGYDLEHWGRLESDLRINHLSVDFESETDSDYGKRYEIVAFLPGFRGRPVLFRSVWQIDAGTDTPRLITMYPE